MTFKRIITVLWAGAFLVPAQAFAACPQALAVYQEMPAPDASDAGPLAEINFYPDPNAVVVTNAFHLHPAKGPSLQGHIIWHDNRPDGALMLNCPDGDVTGEELRACTHWVGAVYSAGANGQLGLMPQADEDAAPHLIFTDLSRTLQFSDLNREENTLPRWDMFQLSGCQE